MNRYYISRHAAAESFIRHEHLDWSFRDRHLGTDETRVQWYIIVIIILHVIVISLSGRLRLRLGLRLGLGQGYRRHRLWLWVDTQVRYKCLRRLYAIGCRQAVFGLVPAIKQNAVQTKLLGNFMIVICVTDEQHFIGW